MFASLYLGLESVTRFSYFKGMAVGWKFLSCAGLAFFYHHCMMAYTSQFYAPLFSAYLRKYKQHIKSDPFEIQDDKKKYFYIDTSQYMNYSNQELSDEYHAHHGPQPVSLICRYFIIIIGWRHFGQLLPGGGGQIP